MKYVTWFIGLIAIVIAVVVGSILIRNIVYTNRVSNNSVPKHTQVAENLKDNTKLRLYTEGPVLANENHESMMIEVTPTSRTVTLYRTYGNTVIKSAKFENNQEALKAFAQALDREGYTVATPGRKDADYAGECAEDKTYYLQILEGDKMTQNLWATSCILQIPGSFGGNLLNVIRLYKSQIPNYFEVVKGSSVAY